MTTCILFIFQPDAFGMSAAQFPAQGAQAQSAKPPPGGSWATFESPSPPGGPLPGFGQPQPQSLDTQIPAQGQVAPPAGGFGSPQHSGSDLASLGMTPAPPAHAGPQANSPAQAFGTLPVQKDPFGNDPFFSGPSSTSTPQSARGGDDKYAVFTDLSPSMAPDSVFGAQPPPANGGVTNAAVDTSPIQPTVTPPKVETPVKVDPFAEFGLSKTEPSNKSDFFKDTTPKPSLLELSANQPAATNQLNVGPVPQADPFGGPVSPANDVLGSESKDVDPFDTSAVFLPPGRGILTASTLQPLEVKRAPLATAEVDTSPDEPPTPESSPPPAPPPCDDFGAEPFPTHPPPPRPISNTSRSRPVGLGTPPLSRQTTMDSYFTEDGVPPPLPKRPAAATTSTIPRLPAPVSTPPRVRRQKTVDAGYFSNSPETRMSPSPNAVHSGIPRPGNADVFSSQTLPSKRSFRRQATVDVGAFGSQTAEKAATPPMPPRQASFEANFDEAPPPPPPRQVAHIKRAPMLRAASVPTPPPDLSSGTPPPALPPRPKTPQDSQQAQLSLAPRNSPHSHLGRPSSGARTSPKLNEEPELGVTNSSDPFAVSLTSSTKKDKNRNSGDGSIARARPRPRSKTPGSMQASFSTSRSESPLVKDSTPGMSPKVRTRSRQSSGSSPTPHIDHRTSSPSSLPGIHDSFAFNSSHVFESSMDATRSSPRDVDRFSISSDQRGTTPPAGTPRSVTESIVDPFANVDPFATDPDFNEIPDPLAMDSPTDPFNKDFASESDNFSTKAVTLESVSDPFGDDPFANDPFDDSDSHRESTRSRSSDVFSASESTRLSISELKDSTFETTSLEAKIGSGEVSLPRNGIGDTSSHEVEKLPEDPSKPDPLSMNNFFDGSFLKGQFTNNKKSNGNVKEEPCDESVEKPEPEPEPAPKMWASFSSNFNEIDSGGKFKEAPKKTNDIKDNQSESKMWASFSNNDFTDVLQNEAFKGETGSVGKGGDNVSPASSKPMEAEVKPKLWASFTNEDFTVETDPTVKFKQEAKQTYSLESPKGGKKPSSKSANKAVTLPPPPSKKGHSERTHSKPNSSPAKHNLQVPNAVNHVAPDNSGDSTSGKLWASFSNNDFQDVIDKHTTFKEPAKDPTGAQDFDAFPAGTIPSGFVDPPNLSVPGPQAPPDVRDDSSSNSEIADAFDSEAVYPPTNIAPGTQVRTLYIYTIVIALLTTSYYKVFQLYLEPCTCLKPIANYVDLLLTVHITVRSFNVILCMLSLPHALFLPVLSCNSYIEMKNLPFAFTSIAQSHAMHVLLL